MELNHHHHRDHLLVTSSKSHKTFVSNANTFQIANYFRSFTSAPKSGMELFKEFQKTNSIAPLITRKDYQRQYSKFRKIAVFCGLGFVTFISYVFYDTITTPPEKRNLPMKDWKTAFDLSTKNKKDAT